MAKVYCYFRPTGSGPSAPSAGGYLVNFGHFLIEVERYGRRTAFDYWLDGSRSVVKTVVDEGRRRDHLYLSFFVSDTVADRMVSRIRAWAANPPAYEFPTASTCVSRSKELLRMAGLDVAGAITPDGLWSGLVAKSLGVGAGGTWVPPLGRDRGDERLTYPVEYLPRRHGVPLPPPSDVAWWAVQGRATQVGQQARLTDRIRRQQALLADLQRLGTTRPAPGTGPGAAGDAARRLQQRSAELAREAARRQESQRREDARRQQERQAEEQREAQRRAQARQVAAATRQTIINEIHSRFRPTPHRVPLPQHYAITAGPPTGAGLKGPLTRPTWTGVVWHR